MADITKGIFSSSTNGKPIAVGSSYVTVHQVTDATTKHEIWMSACCYNANDTLTVTFTDSGGTYTDGDHITCQVLANEGPIRIVPGLIFGGENTGFIKVKGTGSNTNVIGYVNKIPNAYNNNNDRLKVPLSESNNGRGIDITATSSPGTAIHTSFAGTTYIDEVYLLASCRGSNETLYLQLGGTSSSDLVTVDLVAGTYPQLLTFKTLFNNAVAIKGYISSGIGNVEVFGYVNRYLL